ncbi:MAG: tetratricopeptide repeat-containing sensor histidine kinase [Bacteroidales bacterium]|jgi:signal transduction histidine kinase|nr:tetratricopeptide repeat-containing sensor histidine kinase [Bacteroidales bacterium]
MMHQITKLILSLILLITCMTVSFADIDSLKYALITEDTPKERKKLVDEYLQNIDTYSIDSVIKFSHELVQISQKTNNQYGIIKGNYFIGLQYGLQTRFDEALIWYHEGLQYALQQNDTTHIVTGYRMIANIFSRNNKEDSLRYYSNKAVKLAKQTQNNIELGAAYIDLAIFHNNQANPDSALQYYQLSLDFFDKGKNIEGKAISLGNIGNLLNKTENYELAKDHLLRAIKINKSKDYLFELSNNYNNIGISYEFLWQLDSAEQVYEKAIEINNKLGDERSNAVAYNNMGSLLTKKENYKGAENYYLRSLAICDSMQLIIGQLYNYQGIGNLYFKQKQYEKSIESLIRSIKIAEKLSLSDLKIKTLYTLYEVHKALNDYEDALIYLEKHDALSDSLDLINQKKRIDQYKVLYETKQKENELLKQKVKFENKSKEVEISRIKSQRRLNILLGIGLILVLVFIVYIRLRLKNKKIKKQSETIRKSNKQLNINAKEIKSQTEKLKIQNTKLKDLSEFRDNIISTMVHDLKTPLNSIIGLSSMEPNQEMQSHIHYSGKNMMNLVSNILDVQRYEQAGLKTKIEKLPIKPIIQSVTKDLELDISIRQQQIITKLETETVYADEQLLRRIFINLLSNAIKYSPKASTTTISASLDINKNQVIIRVSDQGEGIKKEQIAKLFKHYSNFNPKSMGMSYSTGIGLSFCKIAVEAMKGEIGILSIEGNGTEVWFTLPN